MRKNTNLLVQMIMRAIKNCDLDIWDTNKRIDLAVEALRKEIKCWHERHANILSPDEELIEFVKKIVERKQGLLLTKERIELTYQLCEAVAAAHVAAFYTKDKSAYLKRQRQILSGGSHKIITSKAVLLPPARTKRRWRFLCVT